MQNPQHPGPAPAPGLRREITAALTLLFAATGLIALASLALPWLRGYQQALLAVALFVVPTAVLRRTATRIDDLGVDLGPWTRTAALSAAAVAIVFPLFIAGHHLVQTQLLGRTFRPDPDALMRWGDGRDQPPPRPCADAPGAPTVAWFGGGGLWVVGPSDGTLAVTVRSPDDVIAARTVTCRGPDVPATSRVVRPGPDGRLVADGARGLWIPLGDARDLDVRVTLDDRPVPAADLRLGEIAERADADGHLTGSRDLWWLLGFLVIHLGLVALPEEWFFRGYLQTRLDQWLGTPWRLMGASVGPGLIFASLAFALLHPILIPGPHRLLVFFPSLLFGWLRARGGNIGPAVVVHALANLLQAVVSPLYVSA